MRYIDQYGLPIDGKFSTKTVPLFLKAVNMVNPNITKQEIKEILGVQALNECQLTLQKALKTVCPSSYPKGTFHTRTRTLSEDIQTIEKLSAFAKHFGGKNIDDFDDEFFDDAEDWLLD